MTGTTADFRGVRACVFDAYGTLFDVSSAARHLSAEIGPPWETLAATWRDKQLQYTWLRSLMRAYADFRQVTAEALDFAMESMGLDDADLRGRLLALYDRLDCYEEVPDVLTGLRGSGRKTAILSNGSPDMLKAALDHAGIGDLLDEVLSVDALRIYKPDPRVYQLAAERLGVAPEETAFFSSNAWDAAGAAYFGFRVVWCNRFGQARERLPATPETEVTDLRQALPAFGI